MNGAIMTIARYEARKIVKQDLYAKAIKLSSVECCEITRAANQYVEDHPQIIEWATEEYHRLVASGRLRPPRKLKLLCRT